MTAAQQPPTLPPIPPPPPSPNRLYRSRTDRILGGVAAGLAAQMNLDPSLVRVGWVLLALVTGGIFGLIYIVMWVIVPEEPGGAWPGAYPPPGPDAIPGWQPPSGAQPYAGQPYTGQPTAGQPGPTGADAITAAALAPSADQPVGGPAQPTPPWTPPPAPATTGSGVNIVSVVIGIILIVVGGIFLLEMYVPQIDVGDFWPLIPIVLGGALLYAALRPRAGG